MKNYFIDTEFIDTGKEIELISIGIVCEDGRELYLQSCEFNQYKASQWVKEHVFANLHGCSWAHASHKRIQGLSADKVYHQKNLGQCIDQQRGYVHDCPWRSRGQMAYDLVGFFGNEYFNLWGWCAGYDFVALNQIWGTMMDVPLNFPHYIRDIQYLLDEQGIADDQLPLHALAAHNALADARHISHIYHILTGRLTPPL